MSQGTAFIDVNLGGLFEKSFKHKSFASLDQKVALNVQPIMAKESAGWDAGRKYHDPKQVFKRFPVRMHNARPMQQQAPSLAEFFDRYGFALLSHKTATQDWSTDMNVDNDATRAYMRELEEMINDQLLPSWSVSELLPSPGLRRGPGAKNESGMATAYGMGVHQDFGLDADDYEDYFRALSPPLGGEGVCRAWRDHFNSGEVCGMMVLNFWRPVLMKEPVRDKHLCVCDPHSVKPEDMVRCGYPGGAIQGPEETVKLTNVMSLRYNPDQKWYYYPEMTCDEILVFKQFDYFKEDGAATLRTCFHSAFKDPTAPEDAEQRQSYEFRVKLYFDGGRPRKARL